MTRQELMLMIIDVIRNSPEPETALPEDLAKECREDPEKVVKFVIKATKAVILVQVLALNTVLDLEQDNEENMPD